MQTRSVMWIVAASVAVVGVVEAPAQDCGARFIAPVRLRIGPAPGPVTPWDFDADGDEDLIAASELGISVLANSGRGDFTRRLVASSMKTAALVPADFDGDGRGDFLAVQGAGAPSLIYYNGHAGLQLAFTGKNLPVPLAAASPATAYLNLDGRPDVVGIGPNGEVVLLLSAEARELEPTVTIPAPAGSSSASAALAGDWDQDGLMDLAVAWNGSSGIAIYAASMLDESSPKVASILPLGGASVALSAGDLDRDGRQDLVAALAASPALVLARGRGSLAFETKSIGGSSPTSALRLADLTGDRRLDLIATTTDGRVSIVSNADLLAGDTSRASLISGAVAAGAVTAADFDGDVAADLALPAAASDEVAIFFNSTRCLAVTGIGPPEVAAQGGGVLGVYGSGLDHVDLYLAGQKLTSKSHVHPTAVTVTLPALEPGEYVIEARDQDSGLAVNVTAPPVKVVDAKLPPVSEVKAVVLGPAEVKLSWTSAVRFDAVSVFLDGVQVAELPGDATGFTHRLSSMLEDGRNLYYEITGMAADPEGGGNWIESWPSRVAVSRPRPFGQLVPGATGLPGDRSLRLRGAGVDEAMALLELKESAGGLVLKVRARQRDRDATLTGLLTPAGGSDGNVTAEAIAITFRSARAGARGSGWLTAEVEQEVAAGSYALWLKSDGGDPRRLAFLVGTDAGSSATAGLRPLVLAYPRSRTQLPTVKLRELVLHPATSSLLTSSGEGGGGAVTGGVRAYMAEIESVAGSEAVTPSYSWHRGESRVFRWDGDTLFDFIGRCLDLSSSTVHVTDRFAGAVAIDSDDGSASSIGVPNTSLFGSRPIMGSPPDIEAVSPDPECDGLAFLPDIATDANVTFRTLVTPAVNATIETVRISLVDPDSGHSYLARNAAEDTSTLTSRTVGDGLIDLPSLDPSTVWEATLNMSDLPAIDEVLLEVTATDSEHNSSTFESRVHLCAKPFFLDLDFIDSDITFDEEDNEYTIDARFPPDPLFDAPITIPVVNITLDNMLDANMNTTLRLRKGDWSGDDLEGELTLTLLGIDLVTESWELNGDFTYLSCPDFGVTWEKNDIMLIDEEKRVELLDDQYLGSVCVTAICVSFYASLALTLGIEVPLDLSVTLEQSYPYFELDACLRPEAFVEAEGTISATALYVLTVSGTLYPRVTFDLPTNLHYSPSSGLDVDSALCVTFDLDWSAEACLDVPNWIPFVPNELCIDSGRQTLLNNVELGGGCDEDPCGSGGGSGHGGGETVPPAFTRRAPAIAVSPDGKTTLMVFVKKIAVDADESDAELYFAVDTGGGWSAPKPVFAPRGVHDDRDPQVAFTTNTDAVLVWTTNVLEAGDVEGVPDAVAGINAYMNASEIAHARWNVTRGWSPMQLLTQNGTLDGTPRLAAVPGSRDVWVSWVGFDEDFVAANGQVNGASASVFTCRLPGAGPLQPIARVSADHASSPDYQPVLAIQPGNPAVPHLFWLRDEADGSRSLMHAFLAGGWSAPVKLLGGSDVPGIDSPSAVFGPNGDGMVAFTAGSKAPAGSVSLSFEEKVYAARFQNGSLGTPVAVREGMEGDFFAHGCDPQAMHLEGGTFAIGFRAFAGKSARSRLDGEAAVATVDFAAGASPELRLLTDDDEPNLEVRFAPTALGSIRTVWNRPGAEAVVSLGDDLVTTDFARGPDARIEELLLPDAQAPPGSEVILTALVRNIGLSSPGQGGGGATPMLRVQKLTAGGNEEVASVSVNFTAAPGALQEVAVPLITPEGGARLRVVLDPLAGELSADDNTAEVAIGVSAPGSFTCTEAQLDAGPAVRLEWQNTEPYDTVVVVRDGAFLARLGGGAEVYVDSDAPAGLPVWSLQGERGGAESAAGAATCTGTVSGSEEPIRFLRGDCNGDGVSGGIGDPVFLLLYLFLGGTTPPCGAACDVNSDGAVSMSDAIYSLVHGFLGGPPPPSPYPACGPGSAADAGLGCASPSCP